MKKLLTCGESINYEYCATVVRIGEVLPIEGADFLGQTLVNGRSIVVRKDMVNEGDIMFYAANETELNHEFLSINNQFELGHRELNKNYEEVEKNLKSISLLRSSGKNEEADALELSTRQMVGFFNHHGRVRMIRLRGCPSMGYLFDVEAMAKFCPEIKNINLEEYIDKDFDTVNDQLFIKAYVPPMPNTNHGNGEGRRAKKRMKHIAKFDRMIPGEFAFHYDTQQLNRNMSRINPDDMVTISIKLHGTSFICGRVLVKKSKFNSRFYTKIFNYLPKFLQFTKNDYDNIYSSRTVIKNQYINTGVTAGFYGTDIWGEYNDLIKDYIPDGMTVYGEIVGYITGAQTMVQKGYDYGCKEGTNKLMPYRITTKMNDHVFEWEVQDVYDWTIKLMTDHPEIADRILPIKIVYHGTLSNLYPNIDILNHWHENVLEAMKNDKEHFGMEKNEPMCKNKVPREGIVLRIDHDPMKEAFKLKCIKFLSHEAEEIDNGTYSDIEVNERYNNEEN